MAYLKEIVQYLDDLLAPGAYRDSAYNGLQVDSGKEEVQTVAFAVDSGQSVIEEAAAVNAQLLVVHHGLLWGGECGPITGLYGTKVRILIQSSLSLYASHLPLDAHPEVGNNAQLAYVFELGDLAPFLMSDDRAIGMRGKTLVPQSLGFFEERARTLVGAREPVVFPFGKKAIQSVGVVSGGGAFALRQAADEGLDLLISGEPKHEAYHLARELGINALFAGHYATETVGVQSLMPRLENRFRVRTIFVHQPTGL